MTEVPNATGTDTSAEHRPKISTISQRFLQSLQSFYPSEMFGHAVVVVLFALTLVWIDYHVERVAPAQHTDFVQHIYKLRQLQSQIDGNLLENRLEMSLNYDNLTLSVQNANKTIEYMKQNPPDFLREDGKQQVETLVENTQRDITQLTRNIDRFKQNNSVLRNSQDYFNTLANSLMENRELFVNNHELERNLSFYVRQMLVYSRRPDHGNLSRLRIARSSLQSSKIDESQRKAVESLLRHGDAITQNRESIDTLIEQILARPDKERVRDISLQYYQSWLTQTIQAKRYRSALYGVSLLLLSYLIYMFWRLGHTNGMLKEANQSLEERYQQHVAMEDKLRLHATVFSNSAEGILLSDANNRIVDVNPAFTRITGYSREEALGQMPSLLRSSRHDRAFYQKFWQALQDHGKWSGEIWNRNKNGEEYPELLSISAVRNAQGGISNYVAVFSDISRIKSQESQLTRIAYYDALTDLPNRILFLDRLRDIRTNARENNERTVVVCIDLDFFKEINDQWGREVGDGILQQIAQRLSKFISPFDLVARLGGDEFAVLLTSVQGAKLIDQKLRELLELLREPITTINNASLRLSASVGATIYPDDMNDADTLLRHADQAMCQAKQSGKNRFLYFDQEEDRCARILHTHISNIREALDHGEFVLYYQPKVNMRTGKIFGVEALIRWYNPQRGVLAPGEFLPYIENTELIVDIGNWVIKTALSHMSRWKKAGYNLITSVNVAGRQLQSPDFINNLSHALAQYPEVARQLEMEILETAALEDIVKVSKAMKQCTHLGVRFSLDDFGTGYSSLSYLKRLPAETIKIDQSFVRELLSDSNNLVIIQGVLGLARAFGREALAEGVETVEHGRLLLQMNCHLAQGYGIARPMPENELLGWIDNWRQPPEWESIASLHWSEMDYPLFSAEIDHRIWVSQLTSSLSNNSTTATLALTQSPFTNAHRCRFGIWYGKEQTMRLYQNLPAYQKMGKLHDELHQMAQQMCLMMLNRDAAGARARIPELLSLRDKVLNCLRELQMDVALNKKH